ncbi:delta-type opioid receptor-like [Lineus longissimus]|uniref:delta-type opioid receptor-like n=1 Tax=Lineus longissimus TaxID=88925 RepID=UPI002B4CB003
MSAQSYTLNISSALAESPTEVDPAVEALRILYVVFTEYAWVVIVLPGIFGNVMSMVMSLQAENRRVSTCNYMTALALADSAVLIELAWGWRGLGAIFWFKESPPSELAKQLMWYEGHTFGMLSGFFLTEMTIDRLIVVRNPMAARRLCTTRRACVTIVVTFIVICGVQVYIFFAYKHEPSDPKGEGPIIMTVPGAPELETLGTVYNLAFGTVIPFIVIVFCNVWIIIVLRKASEKSGVMGVNEKTQKTREKETTHLTRMLILVSIAYVVTSIPYRLYDIIIALPGIKSQYDMKDEYWKLRYNCQFLIIGEFWDVNYGINFYLYCLGGGKKYRDGVKEIFRKLICKKSDDM